MLPELTNILILSLVAGLSTGLGGLIVTFKRPGEKSFGLLIGYAAGVMLVISFLGLVNEAWQAMGYLLTTVSFAVGTFFTFALDVILPHIGLTSEEEGVIDVDLMHCGLLLALGIAIHNLPEGVSMGASYLHAPQLGVAIALAIAVHNIPEGIATALPLYKSGTSKMKAFSISLLSGLVEPAGAVAAAIFLTGFKSLIPPSLAFAGGVMFFLTLDELMPVAHEHGHDHATALGLIFGALSMMVFFGLFSI